MKKRVKKSGVFMNADCFIGIMDILKKRNMTLVKYRNFNNKTIYIRLKGSKKAWNRFNEAVNAKFERKHNRVCQKGNNNE